LGAIKAVIAPSGIRKMIEPKPTDIGRKVIYREHGDFPGRKVEEGIITSFNASYVFVRYAGITSAATLREDLEWAQPDAR